MKARLAAITAKAQELEQTVAGDAKWSWALGVVNIGTVSSALQRLRREFRRLGSTVILQSDTKELKASMGPEVLRMFQQFLSLEPAVAELEKARGRLFRVHKARGM